MIERLEKFRVEVDYGKRIPLPDPIIDPKT